MLRVREPQGGSAAESRIGNGGFLKAIVMRFCCVLSRAVPSAVHILLALALVRKHGSAVVQAANQVGGVVLTHRLGSVCFIASGWRLPSFDWPRHGDDAVTRLTGFAGGADCFLAVCELGLLPFLGHRLVSVVWL